MYCSPLSPLRLTLRLLANVVYVRKPRDHGPMKDPGSQSALSQCPRGINKAYSKILMPAAKPSQKADKCNTPKDQQNIVNPGIIPCERQKLLVSDRTPMGAASLKMPQRRRQCVVEAVSVV
jgi:hypothetical protein